MKRYLSLFLTLFVVYGSWFCEELWNVVSLIFGGLVEIGRNDGLWMLALDWFMTNYVIKVFFKYF